MNEPTNDNDIDALRFYLNETGTSETHRYRRALTALVAERDALRKNTTVLESELTAYAQRVSDLIAEKWRLQDRIKELEAHPTADRDLRAEIDKLSSSVSILTCRVAALESAKIVGPHIPVNPWNPYPTTPWIIYGTRTSDRIEESA